MRFAGDLQRLVAVGLEHHHLLGRQDRVGAEDLASLGGVLDGHEVRVGARGLLGGQAQHLRPERGEHGGRALGGPDGHEDGAVHRRRGRPPCFEYGLE